MELAGWRVSLVQGWWRGKWKHLGENKIGDFYKQGMYGNYGRVKSPGMVAGIVRGMAKCVKGNYFIDGDILQTDGALAIKRTMVTAGSGRVVIVKPGISGIGGVLLAAYKVRASTGVGFEGCAKIQNKCYKSMSVKRKIK